MRDEARSVRFETGGSERDDLLAQALARANLVMAWKRVEADRGSPALGPFGIVDERRYVTEVVIRRRRPVHVSSFRAPGAP